ncbi:MAG: putative DNA binding domain-containing protein [Prevotella sp.]|nr:putative DNA binding domain-containing protein [Prevotella sp.]
MRRYTIEELQNQRESEDHVEFKKAQQGNFSYNGAGKIEPKDRRKCILGYVAALCNEDGGRLVLGMHDDYPHKVIGTKQAEGAIGQLESDIYRDMGIRPTIYELYDGDNKRVLVIEVPKHPIGKVFKFEDVALMRVGEELKPMDDKTYISIIQEQEPDFSQQYCDGATLADLDVEAIAIMKDRYARKQNNPEFASLPDRQALSDLNLINGERITNAAVLLVGKEEYINKVFPQAKVMLEYRNAEGQIEFNKREMFGQPFFKLIDLLWTAINKENKFFPVREGAYIFQIPYFNEVVIREVVNNAFAHRDYRRNSEIVIRLYPERLDIVNAGGFPKGVSLDNLLTVPSTPRNRLLADVLSKTGIVERSGQGMDKIFLYTLAEGKPLPDYTKSDDFDVTAILSAIVKDAGFALFIQSIQKSLSDKDKLTVFDVLELCKIRDGQNKHIDKNIAKNLEAKNCIEKHGKTNAQFYTLARSYYEVSGKVADYSMLVDWDASQVLAVLSPYLEKYKKAKKADILKIVGDHISEKQLRSFMNQLKEAQMIKTEGERGNTVYMLGDKYREHNDIMSKALSIGLKTLRDNGEIK